MKRICSLILVFVLLMSFASCSKDNQSTKKQDGLVLSIKTDKEIYTAEETVHITATIENKSEKTTYYIRPNYTLGDVGITITIFDPDGLEMKDHLPRMFAAFPSSLEPDKPETFTIKFPYNYFADNKPDDKLKQGEYTAVAEYLYSFEEVDLDTSAEDHIKMKTSCKFTIE